MYRLLLRLAFPRRIRRQFGEDMVRMFEAQRAAARADGDSLVRFWIDAIGDAAVHGASERLARLVGGCRTVARELRRWRWWMHAFLQDLRHSLRLVVKQPGASFIAVLTLALGIGANTAIFSAVDAVLLRPLPYPQPDRLVMVWEKRISEGVLNNVVAPADFLDWSRMNGAFDAMAAYIPITADLTGAGEPARLSCAAVSPPFFDILGTRPILGRNFRAEEASVGQHRVVILSHGLWERRFGSNASIVGQKIVLNGIPHEVVGVLPRTFEFPDRSLELWAPLALGASPSRVQHSFEVYARLKEGVTIERARAEMDRVGAELSTTYPEANRTHGAHVVPLREELTAPARSGLLLLLGAVAFVLLIACVNVANLLLARAASRRREMAVRAALGAGRGRLAGQSLTESLVLGVLGGAAGLLVARWGIGVIRALAPSELPVLGMDRLGLDPRVLLFTLLLSVLTSLLFGLLPAWHLASQDVGGTLKDGSRTAGGVRRRIRLALVVGEIALASLLLVGAGLTLRSFQTLLKADAGIRTDGVLTTLIVLPNARYSTPDARRAAIADLEQRFAAIPGVRSVGATSHLPLSGQNSRTGIAIEGREPTPDTPTRAHPRGVTVGYFKTMGITLVSGRLFTAADREGAPLVTIVNETLVRQYIPEGSPIGRRLLMGGTQDWREIVGVVRDVRHWGLDRPVNPEYYMPMRQFVWSSPTFALAVDGDPASVAGAVRAQLRAVDPNLPLAGLRTMEEVAARSVASRRASMLLLAIFGALALVLAAAGIYGVMAHLVALRTSEIGVRMTLGARPADVLTLVLREGLVQATAGLAVGLSAGVLLMRSFEAMLFGVRPADPLTLAAVAVMLLGTALAACLVPAMRAMRVDPVEALRG
jgi:putative ABC transport system permease protein